MKQIFVRPARQEDMQKLALWANSNPAWDPRLLPYTLTWCAFHEGEVIALLPMQRPMMIEAVAFHPLATYFEKALALKELTKALITNAYELGVAEIYFLGSDAATNGYAENHGVFRPVDMPTFRVRLSELEASK